MESEYPVSIFPNPANEYLIVSFNQKQETPLFAEIFDMYGNLLYQVETAQRALKIDVNNYKSGIYILKININNKHCSEKIIINRP